MKRAAFLIAFLLTAVSCATMRQETKTHVDRAVTALGGAEALAGIKTMAAKGTVRQWEPEQSMKPGGEMRFACEVAHAAAGLSRRSGNEIVKALLARYEPHLQDPPAGERFQDCYNVATLEPTPEHYDVYQTAKEEMSRLGLPL